ncbi:LysR family transcriptional regulator [Pseudomonas syringae]|uniref:LysR family transcriptional regulator n=1 Tax=Pseudomonas syringae TaxID=317 RepID=UPI000AB5FE6F
MDILGLINTYIRVVENGSIAAAARAQGMSAAAVSQSITRLEAHLGVRLLSRTTRRMALTESGTRYFEKVRHIPRDVDLASQAAAVATEPRGPLCIATTTAFGCHVLAPLMPAFKEAYPHIDIELISTNRRVDHRLEGVDVSIRIEAQLNDQLIARRIASRPFVFCASPAYLDRAGVPTTPEDLKQHACIVFRYPTDGRFLPGPSCLMADVSRRRSTRASSAMTSIRLRRSPFTAAESHALPALSLSHLSTAGDCCPYSSREVATQHAQSLSRWTSIPVSPSGRL